VVFRARTRPFAACFFTLIAGIALASAPAAVAAEAPKPLRAKAAAGQCRDAAVLIARRAALRRAIRCVLNQQRARNGLNRLAPNRRLGRAANRHAADMARHNYFSHVSLRGTDPLRRVRAAGWRGGIGETLAWGCGTQASPAAIVAAWLGSPPHRAIILGRGRVVGIGYARGPGCSGGRAFFVAEVG
jgi:uncharacterized protein YkwD